jgi:hypothetical protein
MADYLLEGDEQGYLVALLQFCYFATIFMNLVVWNMRYADTESR